MRTLVLGLILTQLGSFSALAEPIWEARWGELDPFTTPPELEIIAEEAPEGFARSLRSSVAIVENPEGAHLPRVLGLRDYTEPSEKVGALIAKDGFSAQKVRFSGRFYVRTPHRNGSMLVNLANAEGRSLASFQLLALGRAEGEIQLNTLGAEGDRRMPTEAPAYLAKAWNDFVLEYDGAALTWSLTINHRPYRDLSVDANLSDTRVARFEIYSGFGAAAKTQIDLDALRFETVTP